MKVLKFGGTSVGSADNILKVKEIVESTGTEAIVVVSAMSGITDKLIATANTAAKGDNAYTTMFNEITERHLTTVRETVPEQDIAEATAGLQKLFAELSSLYDEVFSAHALTEDKLNTIVSYGEKMSSSFIAFVLGAKHFNSINIIKTKKYHKKNILDKPVTYRNIAAEFETLPKVSIMGGFISSDSTTGETTNLGRGGSDYTAAILAGALDAEALEIWTDVDGFMTADPRLVNNAYVIDELSYIEAMELSNFGAKVLYPPTIYPVYERNIPIFIKNTNNHTCRGTRISNIKNPEGRTVKGISSINDTCLITLQGMGMVGVLGISSRTFKALADEGISVFLISQASSENSTTFAIQNAEAEAAIKALSKEFSAELERGEIWSITPQKNLATVAIVGENMRFNTGLAGKLFDTLGRSGVNIIACAQGASETNISFVITQKYLKKALNVLHDSFFLADYQVLNIFQVGTGTVGGSLLEQIEHQQEKILKQNSVKLNVVGITDINGSIFNADGIDLKNYKEEVKANGRPTTPEEIKQTIIDMNLFNSVFVDCTASAAIASLYTDLLNHNVSIVAANKIAASGPYSIYENLKSTARKKGIKYLFETNVGAGLPIINTMNSLINSGDRILKIEAVLSGTLNFIFNTISKDISFSKSIQMAKEARFSEPDPRIDLSGTDVIRKLVILARESGYAVEQADVKKNLFVPDKYFEGTLEDFWKNIPELDEEFEKKRQELEKEHKKYRFVATMKEGECSVGLQAIDASHPFYDLEGSNNIVMIQTERYFNDPMIIKGYGAGASVTAAGVFGDIMSIANIR
ncbi:MAG: bifunctional aspartate kinase/homoserine dehydrogenase I [Paludibacteraceae bacterium]|nr:bifunctional aspartate kinase/homoserine dehydrogenase I [Paludibacteraceae bacterium]